MIQITIWYDEILRALSFALVIVCTEKHIIPYMCSKKTSNKMNEEQFPKCGQEQKSKEEQNVSVDFMWNTNLRIFQRQLFKVILLNEFHLFSLWSKRDLVEI